MSTVYVMFAASILMYLYLSSIIASSISLAGDHNGSGEYHAIIRPSLFLVLGNIRNAFILTDVD